VWRPEWKAQVCAAYSASQVNIIFMNHSCVCHRRHRCHSSVVRFFSACVYYVFDFKMCERLIKWKCKNEELTLGLGLLLMLVGPVNPPPLSVIFTLIYYYVVLLLFSNQIIKHSCFRLGFQKYASSKTQCNQYTNRMRLLHIVVFPLAFALRSLTILGGERFSRVLRHFEAETPTARIRC